MLPFLLGPCVASTEIWLLTVTATREEMHNLQTVFLYGIPRQEKPHIKDLTTRPPSDGHRKACDNNSHRINRYLTRPIIS